MTRRGQGDPDPAPDAAAQAAPADGAGDLFEVLFEDADLLVLNKPAGLVCHPTKQDARSSLIGRVRLHLGAGGRAHLVNRLDRETSGVVVAAKNPAAARDLGRLWETRAVAKTYFAIVRGRPAREHGVIEAPLGRDERSPVAIKDCVRPDGAPARTEFWVERAFDRDGAPFALLRVVPQTGRKHQIRIHLAHLGHPIVGDKIYGGDERIYLDFVQGRLSAGQQARLLLRNHALHAAEARFPWRGQEGCFRAAPGAEFTDFVRV